MSTTSKPNHRIELYTQQPMVNWLGPLELLRTGLRTAVATTLGAFADPREVQAALKPLAQNAPVVMAPDADGGVWVDYLADTGDGWNSTYSMALCVSHNVKVGKDEQAKILPRSRVLLLGGDQVYPTPAQGGYRTRFLDPFRAASPSPVPAARTDLEASVPVQGAVMLATPGNHDWYDGLRGFADLFCNGKPIGDWQTRQRTSYYALQLPGGWWVWGLDLQLESSIDWPQRVYFEHMATLLKDGDRVVVCTPEPSWVDEAGRVAREGQKLLPSLETQTPRFRSLREIEHLLGKRLALVIAGDSHHYARYEPVTAGAPQRITCGGGGAFLHGTHQLPDPPETIAVAGVRQRYTLARTYPDKDTSKSLRNRAWRLPTRNFSFCGVLAALYLLFLWMVQSASMVPHSYRSASLMEELSQLEFSLRNLGLAWHQLFWAMAHSPSTVVFALVIIAACGTLSSAGVKRGSQLAFAAGTVHGFLHLGLAVGLLWLMGRVNIHYGGLGVDQLSQVAWFVVETLVLGGGIGGLLFGIWMVMANMAWGLHGEEVFSSQCIEDHKCFLRMRFDAKGLTVYPLKLEQVCRRWAIAEGVDLLVHVKNSFRLQATTQSAGPRFVPAAGQPSPLESLELIEQPIVI